MNAMMIALITMCKMTKDLASAHKKQALLYSAHEIEIQP